RPTHRPRETSQPMVSTWRGYALRSPRARKIALCYHDEQGRETRRTVWPVTVGYMETVRHLIAWCELRQDFRSFRTDRVTAAGVLDERYTERPSVLRNEMAAHPPRPRQGKPAVKIRNRMASHKADRAPGELPHAWGSRQRRVDWPLEKSKP